MTQDTQTTDRTFAALILILVVGLLLYPAFSGGCHGPAGFELATWLGKVRVKPLPPEPVITPPATRCLIFSATWCKPCGQLKRNVATMARAGWRIGALTTDDIEIIDVDGPDERLRKYKHSGVPTLVITDQAGKELQRREGVQTADELGEWIRSTRAKGAEAGSSEAPVKRTGAFELLE